MPSKCPFYRRKYSRSGAYEKHLRTAHASLASVLASTVEYNNIQTGELLNADPSERQDSDYESDPGPAGLEPDAFCPDIASESDAEVFDTTSACAWKQNHFEGAREVIRDVPGFEDEHSNVCADPCAPFNSAEGFKLASLFIDGKVSKNPNQRLLLEWPRKCRMSRLYLYEHAGEPPPVPGSLQPISPMVRRAC